MVWGPVSIIHVRFQIHSVLCFHHFIQIQNHFFYVAWGPMYLFFVYVVIPLASHYGLCFSSLNYDCVIRCDMVGACVYEVKFYHPL